VNKREEKKSKLNNNKDGKLDNHTLLSFV